MSTLPPPQDDDPFAEVERLHEAEQTQKLNRNRTLDAAMHAAFSLDVHDVTSRRTIYFYVGQSERLERRLRIDIHAWAPLILQLARCLADFPGWALLKARPIPAQGHGMRLGAALLRAAAAASTSQDVKTLLDKAMSKARPAIETDPQSPEDTGDAESQIGIWMYLRDLAVALKRGDWDVPVDIVTEFLAIAHGIRAYLTRCLHEDLLPDIVLPEDLRARILRAKLQSAWDGPIAQAFSWDFEFKRLSIEQATILVDYFEAKAEALRSRTSPPGRPPAPAPTAPVRNPARVSSGAETPHPGRSLTWKPDDEQLVIGDTVLGDVWTIRRGTATHALMTVLQTMSYASGKTVNWHPDVARAVDMILRPDPPAAKREGRDTDGDDEDPGEATAWDPGFRAGADQNPGRRTWPAGKGRKSYQGRDPGKAASDLSALLRRVRDTECGKAWHEYWIHDAKGWVRIGPPDGS